MPVSRSGWEASIEALKENTRAKRAESDAAEAAAKAKAAEAAKPKEKSGGLFGLLKDRNKKQAEALKEAGY